MEELLRIANKIKEEYPPLVLDVDSIVNECKNYITEGRNEGLETSYAIDNINEIVRQYNELCERD